MVQSRDMEPYTAGADPDPHSGQLHAYLDYLMVRNRQLNLVSRRMQAEQLDVLLTETLRLGRLIAGSRLFDVGSGNGLLGIPLAITRPDVHVTLMESIEKKAGFLRDAAAHLGLDNVDVFRGRLESFRFPGPSAQNCLVARGFPSLVDLARPLVKGSVHTLVAITSLKKIEKLSLPLEKVRKTIYNIPFRDVIKILKMENVSRETINVPE